MRSRRRSTTIRGQRTSARRQTASRSGWRCSRCCSHDGAAMTGLAQPLEHSPQLLDAGAVQRITLRLAHEIAERHPLLDGVVIVGDDVLFTGRTLRAALDALVDCGRPAAVEVLTLIDRGHRELPLRATYVGKNVPTAPGDRVFVRLREADGVDGAWLRRSRA